MMTIDTIIEKKPHLKDTLRLYEKVVEFNRIISGMKMEMGCDAVSYPPELTGRLFENFSVIFDLHANTLLPLKEAMQSGHIDLSRLPLNEIPAFSLPYHEDELSGILFLLGRPYFLQLNKSCKPGEMAWNEGRCVVCHSTPSIAFLDAEGRRRLHCSFCGTAGHFRRMGCPVCLGTDTDKINIITLEGEDGFRIDTCDACGSYWKTLTGGVLNEMLPDLADLVSMPLDIIAQGKGYRRHSPNPIGITSIA